MARLVAVVLLFATGAAAADREFEEALAEVDRIFWDQPAWATWEDRINVEWKALGDLGLRYPGRWEVFYRRGLNRCKRAFYGRAQAESWLARYRTSGATKGDMAIKRQGADRMIGIFLREARDEIARMKMWMHQTKETDPDVIHFTDASLRFASREYEPKGNEPGAIRRFQQILKRGFMADACAAHIAWAYVDLGYMALQEKKYADAHRYWDEGLKWARQPSLRQLLFTNKAGAYEMDNDFALAEKLLREQIESQPHRPMHHKNLGLVLGYQGRLREALVHYRRARELCLASKAGHQLALLHGNAWIRAATIHGTLLERDGDVLLAWRLFLQYRALFGDDYNFCVWFGEFAQTHKEYDLAWTYFTRARGLRPYCTVAYQKLTKLAPFTSGTREEVKQRIEESKKALADAQKDYVIRAETPTVERLCSGLGDLGDVGIRPTPGDLARPDPLAGFGPASPPEWVRKAAAEREPFVPWRPGAGPEQGVADGAIAPAAPAASAWGTIAGVVVGILAVLAAAAFLVRRRMAAA